jgi:hypothetical protein
MLFPCWNLLLLGARVRVRSTDAEPIEKHQWHVWAMGAGDEEIEVPLGTCGTVIEYHTSMIETGEWIVAWDDQRLGVSLFEEPLAAVEVIS